MSYTNMDNVIVLFDRKGKRHSWQILSSVYDDKDERLDFLAKRYQVKVKNLAGWDGYEQMIETFDTSTTHQYPDTLPANHKGGKRIYPKEF